MTMWRGVSLDDRTAAMMDEVVRLCPNFHIDPSQGSWSGAAASAGTHSGCGAIDITNLNAGQCDELVAAMRRVGFAAWHRTPEQSDWVRHVHGIAVQPGGKHDRGCLHSSAHDQVVDYYEGRNGLASGARDDGPRDHVGTTWESYEEDDMPTPAEVAAAVWAQPMNASDGQTYPAQAFLEQSNMQAEDTVNFPLPYYGGAHLWTVLTSTLDLCKEMKAQLDRLSGGPS